MKTITKCTLHTIYGAKVIRKPQKSMNSWCLCSQYPWGPHTFTSGF